MRGLLRAAEVYVYWRLVLEVAGVLMVVGVFYMLWVVLKAAGAVFGL